MYAPILYLLAALLVGPLLACGDNNTDGAEPSGSAGSGPVDDELPKTCKVDPADFALNQEVQSEMGLFAVRLMAAAPAPPQKHLNDWEVEILQLSGSATEDDSLKKVEPFMPAHGHDGNFAPDVTAMGAGAFMVGDINLWMGGGWTVTFFATVDGQEDKAVVDVCIED